MLIAPWPTPYTTRLLALPVPLLNQLVASLLDVCVRANDDSLPTKGTITRFHAREKPPLEIGAYLSRLTVYTPFSRDAILLTVLYLDIISRLTPSPPLSPPPTPVLPGVARRPAGPPLPPPLPVTPTGATPPPLLNSFTIHRLLAATLLCASRFTSDSHIQQPRAAKVAGVDLRELVRLEVEVLKALQWRLFYSLEDVEGVSRALLEIGEDKGLVDRIPVVEASTKQDAPAGEDEPAHTARSSFESSDAASSYVDSLASSTFHSPLLIPSSLCASPNSSGPSSPASYDESGSEQDESEVDFKDGMKKTLGSRSSSDTVRRMGTLSFASAAAEVEVVSV
ncbi:hypothetical protein RQP46_006553 [Phenoliferia psychrophenolica]